MEAAVEAGVPRSDLHRPWPVHPRHQSPGRRFVSDTDRRNLPGSVVLRAAGTHLSVVGGHVPRDPRRTGDPESTGRAATVEATAFLARCGHSMDGPPSGTHG